MGIWMSLKLRVLEELERYREYIGIRMSPQSGFGTPFYTLWEARHIAIYGGGWY
jgi:hypothetical protein